MFTEKIVFRMFAKQSECSSLVMLANGIRKTYNRNHLTSAFYPQTHQFQLRHVLRDKKNIVSKVYSNHHARAFDTQQQQQQENGRHCHHSHSNLFIFMTFAFDY